MATGKPQHQQETSRAKPQYVGSTAWLLVNQGGRNCKVLARIGDELLVEYEMPSGVTALAFASVPPFHDPAQRLVLDRLPKRPCTYRSLLKRWLVAVIEQSGAWQGLSHAGLVPPPQQVLEQRQAANKGRWATQGWTKVKGHPMDYLRKRIHGREVRIAYERRGIKQRYWAFLLFVDGQCRYIDGGAPRFATWAYVAKRAEGEALQHTPRGIAGAVCPEPISKRKVS